MSPERHALRCAWRAVWLSRLLVWSAGMAGALVSGADAYRASDPEAGDPSTSLSALLLSPARRWDSAWFLAIADQGYDVPSPRTAFFPLYPLLIRAIGEPIDAVGLAGRHAYELAGVLISLTALLVALYLLHRLTEIELGRDAADLAVVLTAFFPMSFFFSAIYSEALFLALTIGCVYAARRGWWWRAGIVGALAAATRSQGILVLIPMAVMLLHGPRVSAAKLRDTAALALVPLGVVAYLVYLEAVTGYGPLAPFRSQEHWQRSFEGPLAGVWGGFRNAGASARDLLSGARVDEQISAVRSGLLNMTALVFGTVGSIGALRRLPVAYGAYALVGLLFSISTPANDAERLKSLARFVIVLFPIFMWLALATERRGRRSAVVAGSAALLAAFSAVFASGFWIA